ncbi:hypothetical protein H6802_00945 [Candidatus Nomurabacteria bacterium]|uniref:SbsA Ig-like domain-containing protein n=1 Tax=candidate division WWE3 bacterium TaxID=2053526 RepID=A0A955IW80_UNCKA|nr:hypothetical protein [candidate division WWE3 bacterium]MCB9823511.1 hypothetical protein [Candidatus Nomurabacteria bacterium]MCB9827306.1 hypothetical protein [Candidatus Nomurabacteria bacterium]HXK52398.1 hypothetical protein [bacterium]
MIEKIKAFYYRHKITIWVAGGVATIVFLIIVDNLVANLSTQRPSVEPVYNTKQQDVKILKIFPPDGAKVSSPSNFEVISVTLSAPIKKGSLVIKINPYIGYTISYSDENPSILTIVPKGQGWAPNVTYTIDFLHALDDSGKKVYLNYPYVFLNTPPDPASIVFPF